MTPEDIEISAKWEGAPGAWFSALIKLRLLDEMLGVYSVHDWEEHNGYAFHAPERTAKAKHAANVRWASDEDARSNAHSNAPSPNPNPDPKPNPKDLPPPNGDAGKTPLVLSSVPKAKKKRPSIEQSTPRTDVGKLLKLWHVTYRSVHGSGYSGDYRKMCGQSAELLADNSLADLIAGAVYLLRGKKHGQYNPHTFDHFVTRASNYIIEAKEEGYVYDPGTDSD